MFEMAHKHRVGLQVHTLYLPIVLQPPLPLCCCLPWHLLRQAWTTPFSSSASKISPFFTVHHKKIDMLYSGSQSSYQFCLLIRRYFVLHASCQLNSIKMKYFTLNLNLTFRILLHRSYLAVFFKLHNMAHWRSLGKVSGVLSALKSARR